VNIEELGVENHLFGSAASHRVDPLEESVFLQEFLEERHHVKDETDLSLCGMLEIFSTVLNHLRQLNFIQEIIYISIV